MREIVLDTETTGLDPKDHRLVEIGCLELKYHVPTGRTYHTYLNPERPMSAGAFEVHGLDDAFLAGQPLFGAVADDLLEFLGDDPLVIHNAQFDLGFLNRELARVGRDGLAAARAIDTVALARRKFPGAPANLDALCKRFGIDASSRVKHGALLDAELLAQVYLELIGGSQPGLELAAEQRAEESGPVTREARPPRPHAPTAEESVRHSAFLDAEIADPIWRR